MLEALLPLLGRPIDDYDLVPDRPGHDLKYANDSTKIRTELGWQPRYRDLPAGLAATVEWYQANEKWWRPQKDEVEARYAARQR
jgi:dTDP-glucose 4,6-dehydratase